MTQSICLTHRILENTDVCASELAIYDCCGQINKQTNKQKYTTIVACSSCDNTSSEFVIVYTNPVVYSSYCSRDLTTAAPQNDLLLGNYFEEKTEKP